MKIHDLKVWPEFFNPLAQGEKRFEARKDDRGFSVGDRLMLREWRPYESAYTGREIEAAITYLISGPAFGIMPGYVVMSIDTENAEIARLTAELAAAQERERVLREAVELAMRYLEPTTNCYQVLQSALRAALGSHAQA